MHRVLGLSLGLMRGAARALLLALSVSTVAPVLHGAHADDCEPAFVSHNAAHHHIAAARPQPSAIPADDHCVACHFARASRGAVAWEPTGLIALAGGVLLFHSDGQLSAAPSGEPLPARAPPR